MFRIRIWILALVVLAISWFVADAQVKKKPTPKKPMVSKTIAAAKASIAAAYKRIDSAIKRGAVSEALANMTDEFTMTSLDGTEQDIDTIREALKEFAKQYDVTYVNTRIDGFKLSGNEADVTATTRFKAYFNDPRTGQLRQREDVTVSNDTWAKTAKGWKLESSVVTKDKVKIDGVAQGEQPMEESS